MNNSAASELSLTSRFLLGSRSRSAVCAAWLCLWVAGCEGLPARQAELEESAALPLNQISLPPGFEISVFASDVPDARSMALGDGGTLFVGSRRDGSVRALQDTDGSGRIDRQIVIAEGLNMPNGVAFREGALYVAEVNRLLRFDEIEKKLAEFLESGSLPVPTVLRDDFPTDRHHGWKYIAFGPDGKLYLPVGAPCNVCERPAPFAMLLRMNPDGTEQEVYARGIRNTVGFDWHPGSGELWFTDNGRDMMGDELPADELNRIERPDQHFGFPGCHASGVIDPKFGNDDSCAGKTLPALELGPHVAALGMKFYSKKEFPEAYRGRLFIAEHGSWNRSEKSGYRIMTVDVDERGNASNYSVFAEGWLQGERAWGRPVDLLFLEDGRMLVSDDKAGVVYQIKATSEPDQP